VESDEGQWQALRTRNHDWLAPWNSSDPMGGSPLTFSEWVRSLDEDGHKGAAAVFAMILNGKIVGEVSLGAISYGSLRTGIVGYWVDRDHAGQGLTPLAVALLADWAFFAQRGPHLHRLEVALLPINSNSRRVVEKLGFTREGIRRHYMHVAGKWQDHETWSLLAEDVVGTVESRLVQVPRGASREDASREMTNENSTDSGHVSEF
jgi:ribosomal-protein-alanine N-acetyltransferase